MRQGRLRGRPRAYTHKTSHSRPRIPRSRIADRRIAQHRELTVHEGGHQRSHANRHDRPGPHQEEETDLHSGDELKCLVRSSRRHSPVCLLFSGLTAICGLIRGWVGLGCITCIWCESSHNGTTRTGSAPRHPLSTSTFVQSRHLKQQLVTFPLIKLPILGSTDGYSLAAPRSILKKE
jgi:hypothetical protein